MTVLYIGILTLFSTWISVIDPITTYKKSKSISESAGNKNVTNLAKMYSITKLNIFPIIPQVCSIFFLRNQLTNFNIVEGKNYNCINAKKNNKECDQRTATQKYLI